MNQVKKTRKEGRIYQDERPGQVLSSLLSSSPVRGFPSHPPSMSYATVSRVTTAHLHFQANKKRLACWLSNLIGLSRRGWLADQGSGPRLGGGGGSFGCWVGFWSEARKEEKIQLLTTVQVVEFFSFNFKFINSLQLDQDGPSFDNTTSTPSSSSSIARGPRWCSATYLAPSYVLLLPEQLLRQSVRTASQPTALALSRSVQSRTRARHTMHSSLRDLLSLSPLGKRTLSTTHVLRSRTKPLSETK